MLVSPAKLNSNLVICAC